MFWQLKKVIKIQFMSRTVAAIYKLTLRDPPPWGASSKAIDRVTCIVCECWLDNHGLSNKPRRHDNSHWPFVKSPKQSAIYSEDLTLSCSSFNTATGQQTHTHTHTHTHTRTHTRTRTRTHAHTHTQAHTHIHTHNPTHTHTHTHTHPHTHTHTKTLNEML